MAKGSMFWSNARGKVGDVVFSTLKGQVITRKYQPSPANPRTDAQQLQRAKFSNAVKFFKHAQQAYFKFAYEDKKKTESDYNAFMRHNANAAMLPTRDQFLGCFPSIGDSYLVSSGSLPSVAFNRQHGTNIEFTLGSFEGESLSTIGDVSSTLISEYGLQNGDIITLLRIECPDVDGIDADPSKYPVWSLSQFRVAADDETSWSSVVKDGSWSIKLNSGFATLEASVDVTEALMATVVVSRVTSSGTLVSDAYLRNNSVASNILESADTDAWRNAALASWAASGSAVLQGSLSE